MRTSVCIIALLSPSDTEVKRERGSGKEGGAVREVEVGEGVWRRGEGVGWVKEGEVDAEEGGTDARRTRRISTRMGLERTVWRRFWSASVNWSCPYGRETKSTSSRFSN